LNREQRLKFLRFYHGTNKQGLEGLLKSQKPDFDLVPRNPVEEVHYLTKPEVLFGSTSSDVASRYALDDNIVEVMLKPEAKIIGEKTLLKYNKIPVINNNDMTNRHLWIHKKAREKGYDVVASAKVHHNNPKLPAFSQTFRLVNPDMVQKVRKHES